MTQQTTVEWLEQEFIALQNYGINEFGLFEIAKKMEKQQIIDAYENGENKSAELYYNETFNVL